MLRFSPRITSVFAPDNAPTVDWAALAPRVACPALLITADPERGGATTPDGAAALKELVPQLHVAHIPAAGHNIRRDQPARFLEVVRAFLASGEVALTPQPPLPEEEEEPQQRRGEGNSA
jgi:pimeloyl-ACP methyl ester carboxylesterase